MFKMLYDLQNVQTAIDKLNEDEIMAIINKYVKDLADENLRDLATPDSKIISIGNKNYLESDILSYEILRNIIEYIYDKYHNANVCKFMTGEENGKLVVYVEYQNKPTKELTI